MLIIGERINTSRKTKGESIVEAAVVNRDVAFVSDLAAKQSEAGADYIDINAGTIAFDEPASLTWLAETVQSSCDKPISFDSPSGEALAAALSVYDSSRGVPMINSVTLEEARFDAMVPLALEYNAKIIALAMPEDSLDNSPEARIGAAETLIGKLAEAGIKIDNIYVDPLTFPISTGDDAAVNTLAVMRAVRKAYPEVHIVAGLSNVSHGLPCRKVINRAMMPLAIDAGLDAAIADPLDRELMAVTAAAEMLLGKDEFCMNYIGLARAGKLI
ncbi:MAG: dihydropteroate synthase [Abditibacteriota bacterium]|nr:dihydropteroate synthase [Abditibacteriota bacterium]